MKKILLVTISCLVASAVDAQTFNAGQVLTASALNTALAAKADVSALTVNVKTYLAGTGGDDLAKFNAAAAAAGANGQALVPAGAYVLSGTTSGITWLVDANATFSGAGQLGGRIVKSGNGGTYGHATKIGAPGAWLEAERVSTEANADLVVLSAIGQGAVLGGSRTSDFGTAGSMGSIGLQGWAINDNATQVQSAYAGYFEARRKTGAGTTQGVEIDVVNQDPATIVNHPYLMGSTGSTLGLWLASGGEISATPASLAVGIINNGTTFDKGIVFGSTALTGADGTNGTAVAIGMAKGHTLQWYGTGGAGIGHISNTVATPSKAVDLSFSDAGAAINAPVSIANDRANSTAGGVPGIKVSISSAGSPANPASTDSVAGYWHISSEAGRNRIWAENPIVDIPAGNEATAWVFEGNMNVGTVNAPDPRNTNHKLGVDLVSGGGYAPSAAYLTSSTTLANRWKHGLWFDNVGGQAGSTLIKSGANVSLDYGLDLASATISYQGIRVGATPAAQVAAVGIRQLNNGQVGLFLQRSTDTSPTGNLLQITNAANNQVLASIDANGAMTGASGTFAGHLSVGGGNGYFYGNISGAALPGDSTTTGVSVVGWNRSGGGGETNFVNAKGAGGAGGFDWRTWNGTSDIKIADLDSAGNFSAAGAIQSSGATAGIGYATGAGGSVAQATSKTTGATLNTVTGQVTMNGAALAAAATACFTLTNSAVAATDVVNAVIASGATAGAYTLQVDAVAAGSARMCLNNRSAGSLSEAVVINYAVLKGAIN